MSSRAIRLLEAKIWPLQLSAEGRQLIVVIGVALLIMLPAVFFGIPSNRDLTNHFRFALPFHESIINGRLYPGWLAESNGGYGDASFRFYPPGLYYLLSLTRTLTGNWYTATLLCFTSIFVGGALGVYGWARSILTPRSAMWASVLFTLSPYHVNQFYQASLLAEFAGCSVLPFAFWFVERTCQKQSARNVAGLAVAYALLILTHLPLAVLGSIALLLYGLARLYKQNSLRPLIALITGVSLGLAASAGYWVTMISERDWIRADKIQPDPSVDYRRNFLFSTFSPDNLNVWWMNILFLCTLAMFFPAFILLVRRSRKRVEGSIAPVVLVMAFALLLSTQLSLPIWRLLRPLQDTQFPWRWLGIVSITGATLTAATIPIWISHARGKWRPLTLLAFGGILLSLAFTLSHVVREAQFLSQKEFLSTLSSINGSQSVSQWLPVWAKDHVQEMKGNLEVPGRSFRVESWESEKRVFFVSPGEATDARLRTYFYPNWIATGAGNSLKVGPSGDGVLLISLPSDAVTVTLQFVEPLRNRVATVVTVIGWLLIMTLTLVRRRSIETNDHLQIAL